MPDSSTDQVLVVAATEVEVARVPEGYDVLITGIGKVAAACALARRLASYSTEELGRLVVVNLGTAGALHDHHTGTFEPGVVLNHDISADAVRALGYDPRERLVVGDSPVVLATGDEFVTDPAARVRLAERAQLVDMEGYAIAYVCAEFGVRVRLIKDVSDSADESALSWNEVVDHSARRLAQRLVALHPRA